MRIGILTQPLRANYGGLLQNFALQQVLKQLGHDPITLDQKEKDYPKWRKFLGRLKGWIMYIVDPRNNFKPRYCLSERETLIIRKYSLSFIEKYIKHTKQCAGSSDFIEEAKKHNLEGFVVGSDQCWRPCYNLYLRDMFLSFTQNMFVKKRIAYAASFGSDAWEFSAKETDDCSRLLQQFDMVSVREDTAVNLCEKFFGAQAVHVLDPTMLLTKDDYITLIEDDNVPISRGKLFNYVLDPSDKITKFIVSLSKESNLTTFQVLPKCNEDHRTKKDVKERIEDCIYPSPLDWIRAFYDAEMVIADSFHGTVFSIIFNKSFWVIGNRDRGLSRFSSLLSMFGLEHRLITEDNLDKVVFYETIDWESVNEILRVKRNESIEILKNSLE